MRVLLLSNTTLSLSPPPLSETLKSPIRSNFKRNSINWAEKALVGALGGALSLCLLVSSPSPSIAIEPSPSSSPPSTEYCREEEGGEAVEFLVPEAAAAVTNEGIVEEAWEIVNDSFINTGRLSSFPETWQFSKMARYDMSGIGINLREVPDENGDVKVKVLGLVLDGPAQSAGVRQGDEVLAVNGLDVKGKSAFEVSSLMQGPNETFVTIKVKHGNCGPIQSIEVQRQLVARTPVFYRLEQIENGTRSVGYMRVKEFNALARKDLVIAMKRLQDMGASYFILDLRDNRGGLVQAGIEIAKLFLNQGETVIYTDGKDPEYQQSIVADTTPLVTAPVIVLVNNNTASASEIVASALHDNCRGVLVGERTFGKGLIQSVFELRDGSGVVVTVGKYVTPKHKDINGNGIEPDFRKFPAWSDVTQRLSQCSMLQRG
ncbi:carboxyl-terminal-processing peptidase 1, chloroplastic isoform X2 [Malus sylvestris]|uniref:carboxyl-terminal-processing peptidase 1, chloroplastic isoform X2 n=1 Tax=Malus sylvestris TaxID=3752 RepID=UPI0021ACEF13|nr:carboxyl-terminal-processing peptidase 1, chloroplastic isoform X2 [Malus sylvestris]